ncbi:MAG: hypothetical protein LBB93_03250, partial [Elusimicrobiota bacterium]|nr:hypothetical protein [Elusimicrobiota bacterium]
MALDNKKLMFQNLNLLTFSNATASAIRNQNSSLITFDSLTVKFLDNDNTVASGDGGAIYNNGSTVSFINSTVSFVDNKATNGDGGAIYNSGSTVSFINSTVSFLNNAADDDGGAIYNSGSSVSFASSTVSFVSNTAEDYGGAIYNKNSTTSFTNSTVDFLGNSAYGYYGGSGGAIYNSGSSVSFVNSTVSFLNNFAGNDGGAIYNQGASVSFVNSTVSFVANKTTDDDGGAIFNRGTVSFVNSTVDFSNNSARFGGAIDNSGGATVSFVNSTVDFSGNKTVIDTGDGGAISNWGTVSFVNSTVDFLGNIAKYRGGAIYNICSSVSFVNSTVDFSNNSAYYDGGGAIFNWYESTVSFVNSTVDFLDNTAGMIGGAIENIWSSASFVNSTVDFSGNTADLDGGAIGNVWSTVSFVNSTVDFSNNSAYNNNVYGYDSHGGAIYNQEAAVSFDNSIVGFSGNSTTGNGGAIFNYANSTIIFKGGSRVIFEGNLADTGKGADIYNNGTIEISENSEVILRSGINGVGGVININSGGVLTISADEIVISTLNVSADGKFSLVDREANSEANGFRSSGFTGSAEPETLYSSKTANIDNLTVEGILEIGIDLSANNANDLISASSITFQEGSFLNIVLFNKSSSPRTYSDIFTGELIGFENLDYDHSFFVLSYNEQTKTLSLKAISVGGDMPEFIKASFAANTIRQLSKFDDSSIYENANENYWGVAQIGSAELKDSVEGKFGANTTGIKAGAALINKKNLKAGVYAGYDFGETSQKADKAEFSAFQVGVYASLLSGNINFKALSAYQATTVKAKNNDFSSDFGINNINFGLSAELQTGKILTPYISLIGSSISSDEISQGTEDFTLAIDAKSYFTLTSKTGVQV